MAEKSKSYSFKTVGKSISGDYLLKLIKIMPRVCKAVIRAKGGYFEETRI